MAHSSKNMRQGTARRALLVPRKCGEGAVLYFLREGSFVAQRSVRLGRVPSRKVLERIRSVFFADRHTRKRRGEPWEVELVLRWLAAHRREVNYIDIDQAGGFEAVSKQLACYLRDPGRLAEKVFYR